MTKNEENEFNIVFMGTPEIARVVLEEIYNKKEYISREINKKVNIPLVITGEDKIRGRGKKVIPTEVKNFCLEKNIKVKSFEKIDEKATEELKSINPDIVIVVAYGKILPKSFFQLPRLGSVNMHVSLLPKYRGPSPIQSAILNGDTFTGVTIMYIDEKMDTGDIISTVKFDIDEKDNSGTVFEKAGEYGKKLLIESLIEIEKGTAKRKKQDENATYTKIFTKEMQNIDFSKSSFEILNLVRALNPKMPAKCKINGINVKVYECEIVNKEELDYSVIKDFGEYMLDKNNLYLKTSDGYIKVIVIQAENSKKMDISAFLRGNYNKLCKKS